MSELEGWIRVSDVLRIVPSKDGDGNWNFPLQKIDQEVLKKKAELGISVHSAISSHVKGEFYALSEKEEGFFESFLKWNEIMDLCDTISERRFFYEPMKLTGCVDLLMNSPMGFKIIDFKCTQSADLKKWELQAAFYAFLVSKNEFSVSNCTFIQLDPNGNLPRVYVFNITKDLITTAISLYNTYVYLTKK